MVQAVKPGFDKSFTLLRNTPGAVVVGAAATTTTTAAAAAAGGKGGGGGVAEGRIVVGDVITAVNGCDGDFAEAVKSIRAGPVGAVMVLSVLRKSRRGVE